MRNLTSDEMLMVYGGTGSCGNEDQDDQGSNQDCDDSKSKSACGSGSKS
jgi:hypothetical protein